MGKIPRHYKAAFNKLTATSKRFAASQDGATAIEYGLMSALIALLAIGGMTALGGSLNDQFNTVAKAFNSVDDAPVAASPPM